MGFEDMMDPELRAYFAAAQPLAALSLAEQRAAFDVFAASWRAAAPRRPGVVVEDRRVPGPTDAPDLLVRLYRPRQAAAEPLPALLWIHGGGFCIGSYDMDDAQCERIAEELQCLVASVEYRLAPEHPFPAGPEDAYAALVWLAGQAGALGVDPGRIAVGGVSAGGGLAAGVVLMARDRGGPALKYQLLIYPCVDDAHTSVSSLAITDPRVWSREASLIAWRNYLGGKADGPVSPYAAPARAEDLGGLPPAFVLAADRDLLCDENIAYAQRLSQAGVAVELHVYPATFHGFYSLAPDAAVSRRAVADLIAALGRGLSA